MPARCSARPASVLRAGRSGWSPDARARRSCTDRPPCPDARGRPDGLRRAAPTPLSAWDRRRGRAVASAATPAGAPRPRESGGSRPPERPSPREELGRPPAAAPPPLVAGVVTGDGGRAGRVSPIFGRSGTGRGDRWWQRGPRGSGGALGSGSAHRGGGLRRRVGASRPASSDAAGEASSVEGESDPADPDAPAARMLRAIRPGQAAAAPGRPLAGRASAAGGGPR